MTSNLKPRPFQPPPNAMSELEDKIKAQIRAAFEFPPTELSPETQQAVEEMVAEAFKPLTDRKLLKPFNAQREAEITARRLQEVKDAQEAFLAKHGTFKVLDDKDAKQ